MLDPRQDEAAAARVQADGLGLGQRGGARPATASVQVRELSWPGRHNPRPQSGAPGSPGRGLGERPLAERLSPARLQALAQVGDLRRVTALELCVDTRENSLGSFGLHLPNLRQLKLNGSRLGSVRDLGTSLGRLQVLWLARCGLADLDGIGAFAALRELYASYNDVADLSPLCLLDQLEVLDLEGNCVDDLGQVRYLQLCPRLATLTLEGNPVCLQPGPGPPCQGAPAYSYRAEVRRLIPQLQVLDELPAARSGPAAPQALDRDWLAVTAAIKAGGAPGRWPPGLDRPRGPPPAGSLGPEPCPPETQARGPRPPPPTGGPLPAGPPAGDAALEDGTSTLTHGASSVLCGNPTKGLRERRLQRQAWAPQEPPPHRPRDAAPEPGPADSCFPAPARREPQPRCQETRREGAAVPQGPRGSPAAEAAPARPPAPPGPAPPGAPAPPEAPLPPRLGSSSRGRRLRRLAGGGPGPGRARAAATALGALDEAAGPAPRAPPGGPGPKPAPEPAARPPGLRAPPPLKPVAAARPRP